MNGSSAQGFTLLELVAALAIFALLSVMAYGGLNALLRTNSALDDSFTDLQAWQMSVHRLRLDLEQLRDRPIRDQFGDIQASMMMQQDGRLEFTHGGRRNPMVLPRATLERVAYYIEDNNLMRESWQELDRSQATQPHKLALVTGVEELQWRFLDSADEWQEAWPPLNMAAPDTIAPPPKAVELQLRSKQFGMLHFLFATRADI